MDEQGGATELERLAGLLAPPGRVGEYRLTRLLRRTATALVFTATGGRFGDSEGVLKLTGPTFAPILERELRLLNRCADEEVEGVVRPIGRDLVWLDLPEPAGGRVAALALPFLTGGDLLELVREREPSERPGADLALEVALRVVAVLRQLLRLPMPIIHGDVRPQNVFFPYPGAPIAELVLIDFDAAVELDRPLAGLAAAPPELAESAIAFLTEDVRGLGDLLYGLATGREVPGDDLDPATDNPAFNALVARCLRPDPNATDGYVCVADERLWRDLRRAAAARRPKEPGRPRPAWLAAFDRRRYLAGAAAFLGLALLEAVLARLFLWGSG